MSNTIDGSPYPEYSDDIRICKDIHKHFGKSFFAGTAFFPRRLREATHALYAFVRIPDEYVDTTYVDDKQKAFEHLRQWRNAWEHYKNDTSYQDKLTPQEVAILRAASYVFDTYQIPMQLSFDFLDAMEKDTSDQMYDTYKDLESYMYGSASVIGVMMTYIMCAHQKRFTEDFSYKENLLIYAKTLGDAFQMTNFIRDVGEDIQDRGRVYLPQEDLRRYEVSVESIQNKKVTSAYKELIKFEIERTEKLYTQADKGIMLLPSFAGRGIYVARVLYSAIHGAIRNNSYDTLSSRARVFGIKRIIYIVQALVGYQLLRIDRCFWSIQCCPWINKHNMK